MWRIKFDKKSVKELKLLKQAGLLNNVKKIVEDLKNDPYKPPVEKMLGDFSGFYSKRINIKHRVVYMIHKKEKAVQISSLWSHYGD